MEIYIGCISDFTDLCGEELLTKERRERMRRFRRHEDRARCLVAGLLLRYALGESAELVNANQYGKLFLPDGGVKFNISHSGEYVVLACDTDEVGIDIEKVCPVTQEIGRQFCTDEEQRMLEEQPSVFYKLWTGKESIVKAVGRGLYIPPKSFSVLPVTNGMHQILDEKWYLQWYDLDGYVMCTAAKKEQSVRLLYLSREELQAK